MRPGLARCPPDQAQGIKPKAGLSKDRAQFFPVLGEGFDLGRQDVAVALGEILQTVYFGGQGVPGGLHCVLHLWLRLPGCETFRSVQHLSLIHI